MCIPCGSLALPKPQGFLGTYILLLLANEEAWRVTLRGSLILVDILRSPDTANRPRLLHRKFLLKFQSLCSYSANMPFIEMVCLLIAVSRHYREIAQQFSTSYHRWIIELLHAADCWESLLTVKLLWRRMVSTQHYNALLCVTIALRCVKFASTPSDIANISNQRIVSGKSEAVSTFHNLSSICPNNYSLREPLVNDIVATALSGKHRVSSVSSSLFRNGHFTACRVHI